MAARRRLLISLPNLIAHAWQCLFIASVAVFWGCAARGVAVSSPLPRPSLDAPVIAAAAPTTRPVVVMTPGPAAEQPRPGVTVPPTWVPPVRANAWKWIVIHHSATPSGSAMSFDREHRAKGWDELGYHFVIGNGTGSGDGQIEVGSRWPKQKWGAHAKTADQQFNNHGIGICLVGNFDIDRPSPAQLEALARLVGHLMGVYQISAHCVIGHGETKPTDCPGRNVSITDVRRRAVQLAGDRTLARRESVNGELLRVVAR